MRSVNWGSQDSILILDGSVCALHCPSVGVRVPLDALDLDTSSSEIPVYLLICNARTCDPRKRVAFASLAKFSNTCLWPPPVMKKVFPTFAKAALNAFIESPFWLYVVRTTEFRSSEICLSDTPRERKNSAPGWEVRFDHCM